MNNLGDGQARERDGDMAAGMWVGVNASGRMTAGPHQQRCDRLSRYKFRGLRICFEIHKELVTSKEISASPGPQKCECASATWSI